MQKTIILIALVALVPSAVFGQSCHTCEDAIVGGTCATLTASTTPVCTAGAAGCFRQELTDGRVARGCASALSAADLATCTAGTTGCKICTGNLCNARLDFQRCHRCTSTAENCAQLQTANQNLYECNAYLDTCSVQIVGAATHRGCTAEMSMPETCNAITCTTCEANYCNQLIFPANRLQCNMCTFADATCFNTILGFDIRRVCDNYRITDDQCYTSVDAQRQVYRGCRTDNNVGTAACDAGNCIACFQSGCNTVAARTAPSLSCIQCAATDVLCAWGFRAANATSCQNNVYIGDTESCYARSLTGGAAERGCSLDMAATCAEGDNTCNTCTSAGCNRLSFNAHNCFQCRSNVDGEACFDPSENNMASTTCPGMDQQIHDLGCYVLEQDNGNVVRGCVRGMESELLTACTNGERCEICDADGCNDMPFGAAGALKALSVTLLAVIAVFVHSF